jgi:hypothetical protein
MNIVLPVYCCFFHAAEARGQEGSKELRPGDVEQDIAELYRAGRHRTLVD